MWAQQIKMSIKPEMLGDLPKMFAELHAAEQPDSGLLRTFVLQDQKDPTQVYVFVVFESEEKARIREQDPRRREALAAVQTFMNSFVDGPPSFVDFNVLQDVPN